MHLESALAKYLHLHSERFSFIFVPQSLQEMLHINGYVLLALIIILDTFGVFHPLKNIDHASHLAGIATGLVCANTFLLNEKKSGRERPDRKDKLKWYEIMAGKKSGGDR